VKNPFLVNFSAPKSWWLVAPVLLLWLGSGYYYYLGNSAYDTLYRAELAGTIRSLSQSNNGLSVEVELDHYRRYHFFPAEDKGGAAAFLAVATVGDSLRKTSRSDTLLLLKEGRLAPYAFKMEL
jgi:hypothetical protein